MSCTSIYNLSGIIYVLAMAGSALAADLPPELKLNDKPIEALCFEAISADEWEDITNCVKAEVVVQTIQTPAPEGWIGYEYRYRDEPETSVNSYSYYEYIGQWSGAPVVVSHSSGGGTGRFTSLMSIEREGNRIRVLQGFGGGDRCNGGLAEVKIEEGRLHHGQWVSPFDFIQLADPNLADLEAYEDLESSAASCFGVANYVDGVFVGITLKSDQENVGDDKAGWTEKFKHQSCFNTLYRAYLTQGKKDLSLDELKEFTVEFNRVCLGHDPVR